MVVPCGLVAVSLLLESTFITLSFVSFADSFVGDDLLDFFLLADFSFAASQSFSFSSKISSFSFCWAKFLELLVAEPASKDPVSKDLRVGICGKCSFTMRNKTGTSTVGAISKAQKAQF